VSSSKVMAALIAIGALACKRAEVAEPDPTPKTNATGSTTAPTPSTSSSEHPTGLAKTIADAAAGAPKECKEADRVVVPGGRGVMIRYVCGSYDLLQLIGNQQLVERKATRFALEPSVHGFWTPLADGRNFMAFSSSECAPAGCDSKTELVRFSGDIFDPGESLTVPWRLQPASQIDFDHDGHPELVIAGWQLDLASAPSGCSPGDMASIETVNGATKLDVDGLAAWSPTKKDFSTTLKSFAGWYAMRLSAARSVAKHLSVADAGACPVETLRTGAEIVIYGRVLGEDPYKVSAEADAVASRLAEWTSVRGSIGSYHLLDE
jgi:hypothetical protein